MEEDQSKRHPVQFTHKDFMKFKSLNRSIIFPEFVRSAFYEKIDSILDKRGKA